MRVIALCALAFLATYANASPDYINRFEAFKTKYNKRYTSEEEEAKRFKIFAANMEEAKQLQSANPLATFGASPFADLSKTEFEVYHNAAAAYKHAKKHANLPKQTFTDAERAAAAGASQDWRPKGAVTAVKNQGQCGSCWSFSTTGGIEGQWFLAGHQLVSLSEQELVSCDTIDNGCGGGLMDNAFTWLLQNRNGSITSEAAYPYVSGNGEVPACDLSGKPNAATITGYKDVAAADMEASIYTIGPLSIAAYAEPWQTYTGGILTNCANQPIDHGILIVGYDNNNNPPYWIIKNSWGPAWGEEGYIRVSKASEQCSIGSYQTNSIVAKAGPTPSPNPTPAPGPSPSGSFVQKTCEDAQCSNCREDSFPQGTCIERNTASYKATCVSNALLVQEYNSKDCSGTAREVSQPTNVCAVIFGAFDSQEFVQLECRSGPAPTTTPAPAPPTTTPAPAATFSQEVCQDSQCTQGCQTNTFAQNTCLQLNGGGSAIAVCSATALTMTVYSSSDCSGQGQSSSEQINTCLADNQGSYFENLCSGSSASQLSTTGVRRQ